MYEAAVPQNCGKCLSTPLAQVSESGPICDQNTSTYQKQDT